MLQVKRRDQHLRAQPTLFDCQPSERSADRALSGDDATQSAIERADRNADAAWKRMAWECLCLVARRQPELTADDVLELLEHQSVRTHNLAALGPVFQRAARAGLILNTDRMVQSRIPRRHRKITVWKSLTVESQRR